MKSFPVSKTRRTLLLAAGASLVTPLVQAQAGEDIVIGGSIPYRRLRLCRRRHQRRHRRLRENRQRRAAGIKGRKLRYVPEDTGYKVDVSAACVQQDYEPEQGQPSLRRLDRVFQNHQPRARPHQATS